MLHEIVVYSIIAAFIGISQSAGIGGGPILNICLMLGFNYGAKQSMSITYIFLMGGALSSMMSNFKRKHPTEDKLAMDYNLIMMTLPMAASGSIFGTITNHFISEFVITILFTVLLSYLSYDTYKKLKSYSNPQPDTKEPMLNKSVELQDFGSKDFVNPALQEILDTQKNPLPKDKLKIVGFVFLYTVITLLTKGDSNFTSIIGVQGCSAGTYIIISMHLMLSYICSKSIAMQVERQENEKERLGFAFRNKEDKMNSRKMWNCVLSGFAAGVLGGSLGLGGAIILVPVWLNSGIDKTVATSSSGPLIFFSAMIAFFMAFLQGSYNSFMQLVFYFMLAFFGAWFIKTLVRFLVERYNLQSMIFILLLTTMLSSLVVLLPFQIYRYVQHPHSFMQFGHFC